MYGSPTFIQHEQSCAKRIGKSPVLSTRPAAADSALLIGVSANASIADRTAQHWLAERAMTPVGNKTDDSEDTPESSRRNTTNGECNPSQVRNVVAQRSRSSEVVVGAFPAATGDAPIKAVLSDHQSWEMFFSLGTEMIITKAGR